MPGSRTLAQERSRSGQGTSYCRLLLLSKQAGQHSDLPFNARHATFQTRHTIRNRSHVAMDVPQEQKNRNNPAKRNPICSDVRAFSSCPKTTAGYRLLEFLTSLSRPTGLLPRSDPRLVLSGRLLNATATRSEATRLKALSSRRAEAVGPLRETGRRGGTDQQRLRQGAGGSAAEGVRAEGRAGLRPHDDDVADRRTDRAGVAVSGVIRAEIGSVREEIRENRARIAEFAKGLARIEAILEERLARENCGDGPSRAPPGRRPRRRTPAVPDGPELLWPQASNALTAASPFMAATSNVVAAPQDGSTTWKPVSRHGPTSPTSTSPGIGALRPAVRAGASSASPAVAVGMEIPSMALERAPLNEDGKSPGNEGESCPQAVRARNPVDTSGRDSGISLHGSRGGSASA